MACWMHMSRFWLEFNHERDLITVYRGGSGRRMWTVDCKASATRFWWWKYWYSQPGCTGRCHLAYHLCSEGDFLQQHVSNQNLQSVLCDQAVGLGGASPAHTDRNGVHGFGSQVLHGTGCCSHAHTQARRHRRSCNMQTQHISVEVCLCTNVLITFSGCSYLVLGCWAHFSSSFGSYHHRVARVGGQTSKSKPQVCCAVLIQIS